MHHSSCGLSLDAHYRRVVAADAPALPRALREFGMNGKRTQFPVHGSYHQRVIRYCAVIIGRVFRSRIVNVFRHPEMGREMCCDDHMAATATTATPAPDASLDREVDYLLASPIAGAVIVVSLVLGSVLLIGVLTGSALAVGAVVVGAICVAGMLFVLDHLGQGLGSDRPHHG